MLFCCSKIDLLQKCPFAWPFCVSPIAVNIVGKKWAEKLSKSYYKYIELVAKSVTLKKWETDQKYCFHNKEPIFINIHVLKKAHDLAKGLWDTKANNPSNNRQMYEPR